MYFVNNFRWFLQPTTYYKNLGVILQTLKQFTYRRCLFYRTNVDNHPCKTMKSTDNPLFAPQLHISDNVAEHSFLQVVR